MTSTPLPSLGLDPAILESDSVDLEQDRQIMVDTFCNEDMSENWEDIDDMCKSRNDFRLDQLISKGVNVVLTKRTGVAQTRNNLLYLIWMNRTQREAATAPQHESLEFGKRITVR